MGGGLVTAPTFDPIVVQILKKFCTVLASISQANGYYNDVADAGIEPLAFDDGDQYPRIVVEEEESNIDESNATSYQDVLSLAVRGFMVAPSSGVVDAAHRLRDDITRSIQTARRSQFVNTMGDQLVNNWALSGKREILSADEAPADGFVEVVVRVSCDYKQFFRPAAGI
jgi:hypothetical protein